MKDIAGKITLITGAAMGIGKELAIRFARDKAVLVLWDIDEKALQATAGELRRMGAAVHTYICDVSRRENVYAAAEKVKKEVGVVDILVNNAGILYGGDFLMVSDDKFQKTFDVNVFAYAWTMKAFLPGMAEKKAGHVVNIASSAGLLGVPFQTAYCASKHAVIGMTDSVRIEFMRKNLKDIHFTIVEPIWVRTALAAGVTRVMFSGILKVDYIADRIMWAMKNNKVVLREPFLVKITPLLKAVSTQRIFDWVCSFLGVYSSMDTFTGKPDTK